MQPVQRGKRSWTYFVLGLLVLLCAACTIEASIDEQGAQETPASTNDSDESRNAEEAPAIDADSPASEPSDDDLRESPTSTEPEAPSPEPAPALTRFGSPSGNITCGYNATDERLGCSIAEKDWEVRSEHIPEAGSCEFDYESHVELVRGELSSFACYSDVPAYMLDANGQATPPESLGYDEFLQLGPFLCLSEETGLSCWEDENVLAGFTMARRTYPLIRARTILPPRPVIGSDGPYWDDQGGVRFYSPSGNILCGIRVVEPASQDLIPPEVICRITEMDWTIRDEDIPIDEGIGPCPLDYGNRVAMFDWEPDPVFTCISDVPWYQDHYDRFQPGLLPYGESITHGPYTCLSETSGMSCWRGDDPSNGFTMARATYPF